MDTSALDVGKSKISKFGDACRNHGFGFKTIIVESCGYVHGDTCSFLLSLAKSCAVEKNLSVQTLYNFFLKSVSVTLQRGLANAIVGKYHYVTGHGNVENGSSIDRVVQSLADRVC